MLKIHKHQSNIATIEGKILSENQNLTFKYSSSNNLIFPTVIQKS